MARVEYMVATYKVVPYQKSVAYSDVENLAEKMEKDFNELAIQGWHVVSIETVLRGFYEKDQYPHYVYPYAFGYSLTDEFVVVLEREVAGS